MTLHDRALSVRPAVLWAAAWTLWLATGFGLPVPPWQAQDVLRREEQAALALAVPAAADAWSIDVGGARQSRALRMGWSVNEAFLEDGRRRSFAWIEGPAAEVAFASPGWPSAMLTVRASPLGELAPLTVDLELDHEARGSLVLPAGWTVRSAEVGPVARGVHVLTLRPRGQAVPAGEARSLSAAVDGVAVGPAAVPEPERDRGVFVGTLNVGLEDRTALFVSSGARSSSLPPSSARRPVAADLVAWYGFGIGGAAGAGSALLYAVHGLCAAFLVTILPGLCWSGLRAGRGAGRIARALGLSTLALLAVLLVLRATGRAPTPWATAAGLALLGGAPLPFLRGRGGILIPRASLGMAVAAAAALAWFALAVVPPIEDQDMEMQATAHALASRQTPTTLTNRSTAYYFAHPPLLHLWQAGTFALSGRLSRVAYYDEAGRRLARERFVEPPAEAPLARRPHYEDWKPLLRRFLAEPQLWPARQVSVLLGAVAVGLLVALAGSLAASTAAGIALATVFLTFPETLVRAAHGAYFAATVLLSLVILDLLDGFDDERTAKDALLASALAFLVDQKGLLVPAAWALAAQWPAGRKRLLPLAGGLLGAAAFLAYGLVVDAPTFLFDFVSEHVTRRLSGSDIRFAADAGRFYPSIPELWAEYAGRYGLAFLAWAVVGIAVALRRPRPAARAAAAAVLLGALVFSIVDWRQTRHLALVTAPAIVALAGSWPRSAPWRRAALIAAAALALRNLWAAWPLLGSFESVRPRAGW